MRPPVDEQRVRAFIAQMGRAARSPGRVCVVGGDLFERIAPALVRYPALSEAAFRERLDAALAGSAS